MSIRTEAEKAAILLAIDKANGNLAKASRLYGCSRSTMFRKIKKMKIRLKAYTK